MSHQLRSVQHLHCVDTHQPGADRLAPTGISCHQVGFDQRGGNFQIRFQIEAVHPYRGSCGCFSDVGQASPIPGPVVLDAVFLRDLRTDEFQKLLPFIGTVQTSGDQDGNGIPRHAGVFQGGQNRGKDYGVWNGPGDVGDDHTGVRAAPGQIEEGRCSGRSPQGFEKPLFDAVQPGHWRHRQNLRVVRHFRFYTSLSVVESDSHGSTSPARGRSRALR